MADVYEEHSGIAGERLKLWRLIEATPWLNWLLLTKRPQNILKLSPWGPTWPDNVWVGTSGGLQKRVETEIPSLLDVPAAVRFVSVEPELEAVNLMPYLDRLQWVICGGESGPDARPFDLAWARDLRDQCHAAYVRFFFKQTGSVWVRKHGFKHDWHGSDLDVIPEDLHIRDQPPEVPSSRVPEE